MATITHVLTAVAQACGQPVDGEVDGALRALVRLPAAEGAQHPHLQMVQGVQVAAGGTSEGGVTTKIKWGVVVLPAPPSRYS